MNKLKSITLTAIGTLALVLGGDRVVQAQATISGSVTYYQPATVGTPAVLYSIGGQLSTPSGLSFAGPVTVTPGFVPGFTLPDIPAAVPQPPAYLLLNYTGINVDPPSTANAQVAELLNNLSVSTDLAEIVSILRANANTDDSYSPASASGTVSYSNGTYLQSISGEITLQGGYFGELDPGGATPYGLYIEPNFGRVSDPNGINYPIGQGILSSLVIAPGQPRFDNPSDPSKSLPGSISAAAALKLRNAQLNGDFAGQISILRAGRGLLSSSGSNQSSASATTTLTVIDGGPDDGFTQSIAGQVLLPNGLFYNGAQAETSVKLTANPASGYCQSGAGCLFVAAISNNLLGATTLPQLEQLIVDPGEVNQIAPAFNFNAEAATQLSSYPSNTALSELVSFIRAGVGPNGPLGTSLQARASGSASIYTPNGGIQSVSGEVSLPPGLYFERPTTDADCRNGLGSCLAISADIQLGVDNGGGIPDQSNLTFINNLNIDPGLIQPGDPTGPTGLSPLDFNARAALALYNAVDSQIALTGSLADVVSIVRAGRGANGIASTTLPSASASGAATLVLPNGAIQTVTGQVTLPQGLFYSGNPACVSGGGCLAIKPTFTGLYDGTAATLNSGTIASLNVDPGVPGTTKPWTFDAAAAYALTSQTTLEGQVSVIRGVAGTTGLE